MTKWMNDYDDRLHQLWPSDASEDAIARMFDVSAATVSLRARKLGLPSRQSRKDELAKKTVARRDTVRCALFGVIRKVDGHTSEYLTDCASKRGWPVERLMVTLFKIIADDNLTNAILDDDDLAAEHAIARAQMKIEEEKPTVKPKAKLRTPIERDRYLDKLKANV
jgi:hypothetical protein